MLGSWLLCGACFLAVVGCLAQSKHGSPLLLFPPAFFVAVSVVQRTPEMVRLSQSRDAGRKRETDKRKDHACVIDVIGVWFVSVCSCGVSHSLVPRTTSRLDSKVTAFRFLVAWLVADQVRVHLQPAGQAAPAEVVRAHPERTCHTFSWVMFAFEKGGRFETQKRSVLGRFPDGVSE